MFLVHWWLRLLALLNWLVGRRTRPASQIGQGKTVLIVGGGFSGHTSRETGAKRAGREKGSTAAIGQGSVNLTSECGVCWGVLRVLLQV